MRLTGVLAAALGKVRKLLFELVDTRPPLSALGRNVLDVGGHILQKGNDAGGAGTGQQTFKGFEDAVIAISEQRFEGGDFAQCVGGVLSVVCGIRHDDSPFDVVFY